MGKANYSFARSELIALFQHLKGQWFREQGSDPKVLYHYTTPQGLLGILSTKRIWASNLSYLNDYMELEYARSLILRVMRSKREKSSSVVENEFLSNMESNYDSGGLEHDVYAVCFCEEGNLLSQWRAYAATGGGYSIEFEVEKMYAATMPYRFVDPEVERIHQRDPASLKFYPALKRVIYDEAIQKDLIETAIEKFCKYLIVVSNWWSDNEHGDHIEPLNEEQIESIKSQARHLLGEVLVDYMFCFKSPTFKEEQEWRIIYTPGNEELSKLSFRASGNYIVPYVELDITDTGYYVADTFPITKIIHGPTLDPVLTKKSLQKLLMKHKYLLTVVEGSDIPLRS